MKAKRRTICTCGYDGYTTDGRTNAAGFSVMLKCPKCKAVLKLLPQWIVRGQYNGESIRETFDTVQEANVFIASAIKAKYTGSIIPKKESALFWEDGVKKFEQANMKPATREYYKYMLETLGKEFAKNNLVDITRERLSKFVLRRKSQGVSARTMAGEVGTVKRLFTLICEDLRAKDYPRLHEAAADIQKVAKEPVDNFKTEFFTADEMKKLVEHAPEQLAIAIRIQSETGLRPGNVYALKFTDISEEGTISLPGEVMKNGKPFITSISKTLHNDIKKYVMKTGSRNWLFPSPANDLSAMPPIDKPLHDMRTAWKAACLAAGLKGTPHKLRHSFASVMLDNDVPLEIVSGLMGHSNIAITLKRYGHITQSKKRDVLEEYQRRLAQ